MTPIVRLKRTLGTTPPASLALGEVALGLGHEMITKRIVISGGTIFHYEPQIPSGGWNGYNIRTAIWGTSNPTSQLRTAGLDGDHIRLAIEFASSSNPTGTLDSLWVGETPGDQNFVSAPTQITFGGLASLSSAPGEFVSDPIPFAYDRTKHLLIAAHYSGPVVLLEQQGALGMNTYWYAGGDTGSQLAPAAAWQNYADRLCSMAWATVLANPPRTTFIMPCDFNIANNTVEAIGAGLNGEDGITVTPAAGGKGGCYARIDNFDPGAAREIPFQIGVADGAVGAGMVPTANSWFKDGGTLVASGGDDTIANCIGDVLFPGGPGGAAGPTSGGGGGGGGAGGREGPGNAGTAGVGAPSLAGGTGGRGGGLAGGLGGAGGDRVPGQSGDELGGDTGSGGGGGGGTGNATGNALHGGAGGFYGAGGGGGGGGSAAGLQAYGGPANDGVLVVTYAVETTIKLWVGTPGGVEELFAGMLSPAITRAETVEDAFGDGVYARSDGQWVQVPVVAPAAPSNPVQNMLWVDTVTMRLYIFLEDHWARVGSAAS